MRTRRRMGGVEVDIFQVLTVSLPDDGNSFSNQVVRVKERTRDERGKDCTRQCVFHCRTHVTRTRESSAEENSAQNRGQDPI